jgi:hypothetical protein
MANYSYSQLKMFLDCREKWHYIYVKNNFTKPGKAAQIGSRVHQLIANGGNIFDGQMNNMFWEQEAQDMYKQALPYLKPLLKPQVTYEKEVIINFNEDRIKGYIDYILPAKEENKNVLYIIDWKTGQRNKELMQLRFYSWLVFKDTNGKYDEYKSMLYFIKPRIQSDNVIYTYPYCEDKNSTRYKQPKFYVLTKEEVKDMDKLISTTINEMREYRTRKEDEIQYTPSNSSCIFCNYEECPFRAVKQWEG